MKALRFAVALMALTLATACGGEDDKPAGGGGAGTPAEPRKVSLVLNWFPEAEHGGFYTALHEGYYRDAGLDVTIVPGGVSVPVVPLVISGRHEFGVTNADSVIVGRAGGADVVSLMAPLQISPRCIMVHEESGITGFEQLRNMKVAINPNDSFSAFLQKKYPLEGVQVVPYTGNVATFLADKTFAQQGYNISEPFAAREQGAKPRVLMLADAGYNPYTSLLIVDRDFLEANRDLSRRMVEASLKGWKKYLESPEATNAEISKLNPQMSLAMLKFGAEELKPMVAPEGVAVGSMTSERWQELLRTLEDLGTVETGKVSAADCFTTEFLTAPGS